MDGPSLHDLSFLAQYTGNTTFATSVCFMQCHLDEVESKKLKGELQAGITCPLLLVHGTDDRCVDVRSSRDFFAGAKARDKALVEFEGKCHVLLSEDEETQERFIKTIGDWIEAHIPS